MKVKKQKKGISLIVLVITIIVMIILASAIIISLSNSGIIDNARKAVDLSNESGIKEALEITVSLLKQENKLNEENLKSELEKSSNEEVEVTKDIDGSYTVGVKGIYFTIEDDKIIKGKYDKWDGTKLEPTSMTDNEIHIYKASELKWVQEQVALGNSFEGYTIYLENNLDLGARESSGDTLDTKWKTDANKATKWTPIGKTEELGLKAKFEGNDHVIKGVYVEETTDNTGLFGCVENVVQNLSIKNSYIEGTKYTGGIVGNVQGEVTVTNCHNINTTVVLVQGEYHTVGGVVGKLWTGTISNSTNSGNVFGNGFSSTYYTRCGGVAGSAYIVNNCSNTGNVLSKGMQTGGIVGVLRYNANNCVNSGYVCMNNNDANSSDGITVLSFIGGIVGRSIANTTIENCSNSAKVEGSGKYVGGIVGGANKNTTIENCSNNAEIKGSASNVGGIVGGDNSGTIIRNSRNIGDIKAGMMNDKTANSDCGGIIGALNTTGEVSNCFNSGTISAENSNAGGIVGMIYQNENKTECIIKNNINVGSIEGIYFIGGIVGWIGGSEGGTKISLCYNKGNIKADHDFGSIVGYETCKTGANTYSHLYYLSSLNLGAINGVDNVEQNVTSTTKDINTFEEFKTWIAQFE